MSESTSSTVQEFDETETLGDAQVAEYLELNPDFFERNSALLNALRVPHAGAGSVSLIERQVSTLREENGKLKQQLDILIANARDNDALLEKTQQLVLSLIAQDSIKQLQASIERAFKEDFGSDFCRMLTTTECPEAEQGLTRLLEDKAIFCGLLKEEECRLLFANQAEEVGSAAVIPLFDGERFIGLIAIASKDKDYYRHNMSTSLLRYIGAVVSHMLKRFDIRSV